jgi:hypothetical protein
MAVPTAITFDLDRQARRGQYAVFPSDLFRAGRWPKAVFRSSLLLTRFREDVTLFGWMKIVQ